MIDGRAQSPAPLFLLGTFHFAGRLRSLAPDDRIMDPEGFMDALYQALRTVQESRSFFLLSDFIHVSGRCGILINIHLMDSSVKLRVTSLTLIWVARVVTLTN